MTKNDTKYCGACGAAISLAVKFCPECGADQSAFDGTKPANPAKASILPWVLGGFAVMCIGAILVAGMVFLPSLLSKPNLYPFCEGKKACGYLNQDGEMAIPAKFDWTRGFSDNGLAAVKLYGKQGYIDQTGALAIPAKFDFSWGFFDNGLARVKLDRKWGYIDQTGALVIPAKFDDAWGFADNGLAVVKLDGKLGYIDQTGALAILAKFDDAWSFADNGLAAVKLEGKWGYIDKTGTFVISPLFTSTTNYSDHIMGTFGDKRYPILMDGTFLGFTRADVDDELDRAEAQKRLDEEQ